MIRFHKVTKKFGSTLVLDKVSFLIDKGEFVFLVGQSGAGKTTIIRLLFRDMIPNSGEISVNGFDVVKMPLRDIPKLRRIIGIVFQDFKVLHDRTVFENIAVALEIANKSDKEIQTKVAEVLDLVRLKGKERQFPMQLSAGELQRTSIARAIVGGPKVLIADEPTGNLDPTTSWEIMTIMKEINKLGTTVIMATHNADMVNKLKKRVVRLAHGEIVKDEREGSY